jgi:hypothetical protein
MPPIGFKTQLKLKLIFFWGQLVINLLKNLWSKGILQLLIGSFVNGGWEHLKVFKREEERAFNMIKTQDPNMI